jgi:HNH endonuclease
MRRDTNLRKKYYQKLCERDGERCTICRKVPPEVYLEVDHRNGDEADDAWENLQLACRSDNRKKNGRGKGRPKRKYTASTGVLRVDTTMSEELRLSKMYMPKFRHWLYVEMKKRGKMAAKEVIFEGAEAVGCSPYTIRTGYLPMVTSKAGMYRQYPDSSAGLDMVVFRNAETLGITTDMLDFVYDDGGEHALDKEEE